MNEELNVRNLRFRYRTGPPGWLFEISQLVLEGRMAISLLGDNMAGKTSFLKLLAGTLDLNAIEAQGILGWHEQQFAVPPSARAMRDMGFAVVNQNDPMFPELSTLENILLCAPRGITRARAIARAGEAIRRFEQLYPSQDLGSSPLGALSGGARALVRILRALAWPHKILCLDEPTANLDEGNRNRVFEVLSEFLEPTAAIVLVSHVQRDHELLTAFAETRKMKRVSFHISRSSGT